MTQVSAIIGAPVYAWLGLQIACASQGRMPDTILASVDFGALQGRMLYLHELQLVLCRHQTRAEAAKKVPHILLLAIGPGIPALVWEHTAQQSVDAVHGG